MLKRETYRERERERERRRERARERETASGARERGRAFTLGTMFHIRGLVVSLILGRKDYSWTLWLDSHLVATTQVQPFQRLVSQVRLKETWHSSGRVRGTTRGCTPETVTNWRHNMGVSENQGYLDPLYKPTGAP